MNISSKGLALFSNLVILSVVLAACAPAAPQPIIKTVEVTVPGKPVVQTQVVEVTPTAAEAGPETGPITAEGLVDCLPIPELPGVAGYVPPAAALSAASVPTLRTAVTSKLAAPSQQAGSVYRVGVAEDVHSTNPWVGGSAWDAVMLPPVWHLYALSEKYFTFVPSLAKALPEPLAQEGDLWTVTIPLREDVRWTDGTPLTANDVAWTANTVLKLGVVSTAYDGNYLQGMEAVDDFTLKIIYHTKPGLARHEYGTLTTGRIYNAAYWQAKMDEAGVMESIDSLPPNASEDARSEAQAEAQSKLGNILPDDEPVAGAYILDKWEQGAYLVLRANPDWADKGLVVEQWAGGGYRNSLGVEINVPEREPDLVQHMDQQVDSILFTIFVDQASAILAMQNGEVDFMLRYIGLQQGTADVFKSDPNLSVLENPANNYRYLNFNTRRRPMNDCAFRQAVAVLIDKEFLSETILQGAAIPLYTFVPPGNAGWYDDAVPKLGLGLSRQQRTDLAREILKQAGFSWEGGLEPAWDADNLMVTQAGRLLMPGGTPVPPLKLITAGPSYDPLRATFAIWIETWLNEFGISLKVDLGGFNEVAAFAFDEQDFDMYINGWVLSIFPSYLYDFFAEEQAAPGGNNAGGFTNPAIEASLKRIVTCESFAECRAISDELQVMLATELPYVVLFNTNVFELYRSGNIEYPYTEQLQGVGFTHLGGQIYPSVLVK